MAILFFHNSQLSKTAEQVHNALQKHIKNSEIEVFQSIAALRDRLCRPCVSYCSTALLAPASHEELIRLHPLQELLKDIAVIIILPDLEEETVASAHRFYPRYVCSNTNGFHDVANVMNKIISRNSLLRDANILIKD